MRRSVKLGGCGLFCGRSPTRGRLKVQLKVQAPRAERSSTWSRLCGGVCGGGPTCAWIAPRAANTTAMSGLHASRVRQHVEHKRTFFYLEQVILKHGADHSCINIKDMHQGIDFFFSSRAHAVKFCGLLASVVPINFRN
eukprot:jgi/Botrbrau1/8294/Bobra.0251s0022.1